MELSLLHAGRGWVAVNKPPGMASQATGDPRQEHVLPAAFRLLASHKIAAPTLHLVHRLDKETSGVLLLALNAAKAHELAAQFRAKRVHKEYLALCHGSPSKVEFEEASPLLPLSGSTGRVGEGPGGKPALTRFRVVKTYEDYGLTLIACFPATGRSHQIRVHLQRCGVPIVGDKHYAVGYGLPLNLRLSTQHHLLHAQVLTFSPGKAREDLRLEAPLPPGFKAICAAISQPQRHQE